MPGEAMIVTLSRPKRVAATPMAMPSCTPGFSAGGTSAPQARTIGCVGLEQPLDVETHRRRRHQAEFRQHRIAPADRGHAVEDMGEAELLGASLQRRAGIGHRDEMLADLVLAAHRADAVEEILHEDLGSSVLPDLEETMNSVLPRSTACSIAMICAGIGAVEHVEARPAGLRPKVSRKTSGPGSSRPCRAGRRR